MNLWDAIRQNVEQTTGVTIRVDEPDAIGGGCINQTFRIQGDGQDFFVKLNSADAREMFIAEAEGLRQILASESVRAPRPLCWATAEGSAWLVMEYLPLSGRGSGAELGRQLAAMHRFEHEEFGWHRNNTIGATPQINSRTSDWTEFWREHRLGFQLSLAARHGYAGRLQQLGDQLMDSLPALFTDYSPRPALLHGDLWSGNVGTLGTGVPVIFDPAVYFGDRETDLAMTELFGGFNADFYAAYREAYPLDPGYSTRRTLYNLYHILNHLNLFGDAYRAQALRMNEWLLSELR